MAGGGVAAAGRAALGDLVAAWPGFAVLRDGQEYLAPLAVAEAIGLGALVARVLSEVGSGAPRTADRSEPEGPKAPRRRAGDTVRSAAAALGVMAVLAPGVLLPGVAWDLAGRLRPAEDPAGCVRARRGRGRPGRGRPGAGRPGRRGQRGQRPGRQGPAARRPAGDGQPGPGPLPAARGRRAAPVRWCYIGGSRSKVTIESTYCLFTGQLLGLGHACCPVR